MGSLPPSNGKTVLVSGINGYIASRIGLDLLEKGYTVRGTSRAKHSADALINGAYRQYADRVQMYSVPVMTDSGAFDAAVKGVTAIIHTASPISFEIKTWDEMVVPAVNGAVSILNAAYKHAGPQLESFVTTSSFAAVSDPSKRPYTFTAADWNTWAEAEYKKLGSDTPPTILYPASKAAAERAIWNFRDEHKPPFAITSINPAVVTGPPVQPPSSPTNLNETLKPVWGLFSGSVTTIPPGIGSAGYIDVRDVSAMHVWAAEHPKQANGQRYLMAKGRGVPQAIADLLRRKFPERKGVIPEGTPGEGYVPGYDWPEGGARLDMEPAKQALGREMVGFEESVLDTVAVFRKVYGKELGEEEEEGKEIKGNEVKMGVTDGKVA